MLHDILADPVAYLKSQNAFHKDTNKLDVKADFFTSSQNLIVAADRYNSFLSETLRVAVVGSLGVGKSDLINNIIGYPLLPSAKSASHVTRFCIEISYGSLWAMKVLPAEAGKGIPTVNSANDVRTALLFLNEEERLKDEDIKCAREKVIQELLAFHKDSLKSVKRARINDASHPKKPIGHAPIIPLEKHKRPSVLTVHITAPLTALNGISLIDTPGLDGKFSVLRRHVECVLQASHCAILVSARLPCEMELKPLFSYNMMFSSIVGTCFFGTLDVKDALLAKMKVDLSAAVNNQIYTSDELPNINWHHQLLRLLQQSYFLENREFFTFDWVPAARIAHQNALLRVVVGESKLVSLHKFPMLLKVAFDSDLRPEIVKQIENFATEPCSTNWNPMGIADITSYDFATVISRSIVETFLTIRLRKVFSVIVARVLVTAKKTVSPCYIQTECAILKLKVMKILDRIYTAHTDMTRPDLTISEEIEKLWNTDARVARILHKNDDRKRNQIDEDEEKRLLLLKRFLVRKYSCVAASMGISLMQDLCSAIDANA